MRQKKCRGARVRVKTVARISQQGGQNHKVGHIFKNNIGCTQKPGAKHEMEDTYFKRGAGREPLASPLATTLVCFRSLRGGSGQEFSNSCRSGQKIYTLTGLCCRKTAALDKSSDAEFMSAS